MESKVRYYLIDYENVHEGGLQGYDRLTSEDHIILFCSDNANALSGKILAYLQKHRVDVQIKEVQAISKNAMDFQIATEVGRLIGENHDGHKCIIISNDQGFLAVKQYWKPERVVVSLQPSIQAFLGIKDPPEKSAKKAEPAKTAPARSTPAAQPQKKNSEKFQFMRNQQYLACVQPYSHISNKDKQMAFELFQQTKKIKDAGQRKQAVHAKFCQAFGAEQGAFLYHCVKDLIK